jgi:hypothetical protein
MQKPPRISVSPKANLQLTYPMAIVLAPIVGRSFGAEAASAS